MATIPLARQQQVNTATPQVALVQPQQAGPDPIANAFAEGGVRIGSFTDKLAEQERKELETLYQNNIAAELSQFETDARARLIELEATGTGDKPFVKAALDDFNERAVTVGANYSAELREEIKVKMLPLREQIAVGALAVQQRKVQEQVLANADTFQNNLVNQVRFGAISEQAALAKLEQFSATVPDNLRLGISTKIREQVRVSTMDRMTEANPSAFIKRAKSGEFNDVDPTYVSRAYERAADTIVRQREAAERAQEKVRDLAEKDPLLAARQSLQLRGVQAPTRDQLYAEQVKLGVHPADAAVVDKATANLYVKTLQSAQSLDEFRGTMEQIRAQTIQEGGDWELLQRNLSRFAREDDLPSLARAMEVAKNPGSYPLDTQLATFELVRDPKAARSAEKLLAEEDKKAIVELATSAISNDIRAMARAGSSPEQLQRAQQFAVDTALIAAARSGKTDSKFVTSVVSQPASLTKLRFDNRNAYYVPADLDSTYTPQRMENLRRKAIASGNLDVPATMPSAFRANLDFEDRAGWTTYGDVGVALTVDGVQVYQAGVPVIKTWSDLAVETIDEQDRQAAGATASPASAGTIVIGQ